VNIKKTLWFMAGIILLVVAYIGIFVPGLPWSTPVVGAAYCFARSSDRMHRWLYSHPLFGPFLTNWQEKKIFPLKLKFFMLASMSVSLVVLWISTHNTNAVVWSGIFMLLVAVWAWRFPSTVEEHERRAKNGEKIAWLK
jgi:uncharacterized membrane protein YbaN (DUF454 family)